MGRRLLCLAAVPGRVTRRVPITPEADFCIDAVEEALARRGTQAVFHTDQAGPFPSTDVIKLLSARGIRIGTDGQGPGRDAVVVEHLWRTSEDAEVAYVSMPGLAAIPASATAAACKVFGAGWSAAAFTSAARDESA